MRIDTKLLKQILSKEFPNNKFSIVYKQKNEQIFSGDIIYIRTDEKITIPVINTLYKYTRYIAISNNDMATYSTGGEILNIKSNEYVETNAVFIIVNKLNNTNENRFKRY